MTARELIEELKELPQDLPVVSGYKEITDIDLNDNTYILDYRKITYSIGPAIVLE